MNPCEKDRKIGTSGASETFIKNVVTSFTDNVSEAIETWVEFLDAPEARDLLTAYFIRHSKEECDMIVEELAIADFSTTNSLISMFCDLVKSRLEGYCCAHGTELPDAFTVDGIEKQLFGLGRLCPEVFESLADESTGDEGYGFASEGDCPFEIVTVEDRNFVQLDLPTSTVPDADSPYDNLVPLSASILILIISTATYFATSLIRPPPHPSTAESNEVYMNFEQRVGVGSTKVAMESEDSLRPSIRGLDRLATCLPFIDPPLKSRSFEAQSRILSIFSHLPSGDASMKNRIAVMKLLAKNKEIRSETITGFARFGANVDAISFLREVITDSDEPQENRIQAVRALDELDEDELKDFHGLEDTADKMMKSLALVSKSDAATEKLRAESKQLLKRMTKSIPFE